jgi:hypothetical protein
MKSMEAGIIIALIFFVALFFSEEAAEVNKAPRLRLAADSGASARSQGVTRSRPVLFNRRLIGLCGQLS